MEVAAPFVTAVLVVYAVLYLLLSTFIVYILDVVPVILEIIRQNPKVESIQILLLSGVMRIPPHMLKGWKFVCGSPSNNWSV